MNSYLFINNKKIKLFRKMDKHSVSESSMSLDSLEQDFKRQGLRESPSDEEVETVMVPFYENDVLVKIPKDDKRRRQSNERTHKDVQDSSYLVNKTRQSRRTYLEMFRNQFAPQTKVKKPSLPEREIRSISPEFGDTERESISENANHPELDFYNTEAYNEMCYEKLLNRDIDSYIDNSIEELNFNEPADHKSTEEMMNNLKSVSEITQHRRARRATVQPISNVKLGGLGPDMENIRPRLERARSLQRYSEKVRMENRLRIYKKSVQVENEKKERKDAQTPVKQLNTKEKSSKDIVKVSASYLVNNNSKEEKKTKILNKLYAKSADQKRGRKSLEDRTNEKVEQVKQTVEKKMEKRNNENKVRSKSSMRSRGINTEGKNAMPPVQINFMVNLGPNRPSSALRKLEEKHRMYQEKIKSFNMDHNNN